MAKIGHGEGIECNTLNGCHMRGVNDTEFMEFLNLTKEVPVEIRFIELMPIGESIKLYEESKVNFAELLKKHSELIPIETLKNSTAQLYKLEGAKGKIGFISPISCKFCGDCNRIRLTSIGTIKLCLHSREEINIKEYLNSEELLITKLKLAIFNKLHEHHLQEESASKSGKMMYQIGG